MDQTGTQRWCMAAIQHVPVRAAYRRSGRPASLKSALIFFYIFFSETSDLCMQEGVSEIAPLECESASCVFHGSFHLTDH